MEFILQCTKMDQEDHFLYILIFTDVGVTTRTEHLAGMHQNFRNLPVYIEMILLRSGIYVHIVHTVFRQFQGLFQGEFLMEVANKPLCEAFAKVAGHDAEGRVSRFT